MSSCAVFHLPVVNKHANSCMVSGSPHKHFMGKKGWEVGGKGWLEAPAPPVNEKAQADPLGFCEIRIKYCWFPVWQGVCLGWEEGRALLRANWCLSSLDRIIFIIWAESCQRDYTWIPFSQTSSNGNPQIAFTVRLPKHVFEITVSFLGDRTNCSL